jgi:hypothetical protein
MKKLGILSVVLILMTGCVSTEIKPPNPALKAECMEIIKLSKATPEYQEYLKRLKKGEAAGWAVALFAGPLSSGTLVEASIAGTPDGRFTQYSNRFKELRCSPKGIELLDILYEQR